MRNVKSGDPVKLTAADVNLWNKTAEAFRAGKFQTLDKSLPESSSPVIITVQNKTGEYAGIFSVFALGEAINLTGTNIDEAMPDGINKDVMFEGNKPTGSSTETVCITLDAADDDTLVSAVILGAVGCVVDVSSATHCYAAPVADDITTLQSSDAGSIKILNPLSETGKQFCYVLLGGAAGEAATSAKIRIVQPKELFPACEYKSILDVYGCQLEYSDDGQSWVPADTFDIDERYVATISGSLQLTDKPHKHWRVNLKGTSKNEPDDKGFYTFGRLWDAKFWVKREVTGKHTVNGTEYTFTAKVPGNTNWQVNQTDPLPVNFSLSPGIEGAELFYKPSTGDTWKSLGAFADETDYSIPATDIKITEKDETVIHNTSFAFKVVAKVEDVVQDIVGLTLKRPAYKLSPSDSAEVAMPPPRDDVDAKHLFFDSKPTPRGSQNHRYWVLTFDQPEVVTKVILDVDKHSEHYIVCPGGRDANQQTLSNIYSFDLAAEKWTATTFPEMQEPMHNMDAKVVELSDKSHQLVVLSGQIAKGFSNIIQGYNFEKDYVQNAVDMGKEALNFAGRPALIVPQGAERFGYTRNYPAGESDFSRSLMVVGGSSQSCHVEPGGVNLIKDTVLFAVQGSTLALTLAYTISTQGITYNGNTGTNGFGSWTISNPQSAGGVGTRLANMATYTRHQNLPVRGILRNRPKGNTSQTAFSQTPVIDFLLIGGFNQVGREAYNSKVVTGVFHSPTSSSANSSQYPMLITAPHFSNVNNTNDFFYYPDVIRGNAPYILGDCCAEYIEERDEIICFGGRSSESNMATAHVNLAVLKFRTYKKTKTIYPSYGSPYDIEYDHEDATWHYGGNGVQTYPDMPHPRWSAASVLIKDLQRQGETQPSDRIFIIGGRNADGFVVEVDVFNLRTNKWESDWKGLDQGELENYTPSGGGKVTVINIGGSSGGGVQSVKAGEGVSVSGDSKNPTVSISVNDIVQKIVQDKTFKDELIQILSQDSSLIQNITNSVVTNSTFLTSVANEILQNTQILNQIVDAVVNNKNLIDNIVQNIVSNQTLITHIANEILQDTVVINQIIDSVVNNENLITNIVQNIVSNQTLLTNITNEILGDTTIINQIISNVTDSVINNETLVNTIIQNFVENQTFQTNIANEIIQNTEVLNQIVNNVVNNEYIITNIAQNIVGDSMFITNITNEILNESEILDQIVSNVINSVINNEYLVNNIVSQVVYSPVFQTNITNGIVNQMLDQIALLDTKGNPIATNNAGQLTVQQAMPHQCGVVKCSKICVCYPQTLSLKSMDGMLEAIVRHETNLFFPMMFPEKMPLRIQLYDKLTFVDENAKEKTCDCQCRHVTQEFIIDVIDPDKDIVQEFEIEVLDTAKDVVQEFIINVIDPEKDISQDFEIEVIGKDTEKKCSCEEWCPFLTKHVTQEFVIDVIDPEKDIVQEFEIEVIDAKPEEHCCFKKECCEHCCCRNCQCCHKEDGKDVSQEFEIFVIDPTKDVVQEFIIDVIDPTKDVTQDFEICVIDPNKDLTQDFEIFVIDPVKDVVQDFSIDVIDPAKDVTQEFIINVVDLLAWLKMTFPGYHCPITKKWCKQMYHYCDADGKLLDGIDPNTGEGMYCTSSCGWCSTEKMFCPLGLYKETCGHACVPLDTTIEWDESSNPNGWCDRKYGFCNLKTNYIKDPSGMNYQMQTDFSACMICPYCNINQSLAGSGNHLCPYGLSQSTCRRECMQCSVTGLYCGNAAVNHNGLLCNSSCEVKNKPTNPFNL